MLPSKDDFWVTVSRPTRYSVYTSKGRVTEVDSWIHLCSSEVPTRTLLLPKATQHNSNNESCESATLTFQRAKFSFTSTDHFLLYPHGWSINLLFFLYKRPTVLFTSWYTGREYIRIWLWRFCDDWKDWMSWNYHRTGTGTDSTQKYSWEHKMTPKGKQSLILYCV